jgi:hypothetical protein
MGDLHSKMRTTIASTRAGVPAVWRVLVDLAADRPLECGEGLGELGLDLCDLKLNLQYFA